ncbi:Hvo_1808 family surface protein [Halorussus limi]|uniref:Hvo_1808 family surface protein n=1 Tax=Halorussus limi TaxID=2938695 RepID=A0A8U0HYQ1_9EURY|nr:Hvo_1808 family surface protein [Halorussus limi]UPV76057.1 Hvo_1808 family surface protein [Halorussus limi]
MRTKIAIAVVLMLVVAGCSQAPGAGTTTDTTGAPTTQPGSDTQTVRQDAVVKPDDPESDVLGWEAGLWYNETVDVTPDDGLNETELNKTVARSMARVERIRQLEFDQQVPVEIMTREEFRSNQSNGATPADRRVFDNAKYESLFMINESADSIAVQNRNSGSSVGGYYSPSKDSIVVIADSGSTDAPKLPELTLAHELTHALQDQQFGLGGLNQSTRELHNAKDGLIEGSANYVQHRYSQRCKSTWNGTCLTPSSSSGSGGGIANMGAYLIKFQPYSDGPAFVRGVKKKGGWEAVNDLYNNTPESTEQIIHPEKYGTDSPAEFSIENRTSGGWERVTLENRPSYGSVGEAGIFSMFMYPFYDSNQQTQIIPARDFFNRKKGSSQLRAVDPLNYNSTYSAGWDGDKLAVFTNDRAKANETGYVWKSVWDSEQDASEFLTGYRKVLKYNGAKKVDGRANTWRIPDGNGFSDAFYVKRTGDTVVVVNAPSVSELSNVRKGAAPAA